MRLPFVQRIHHTISVVKIQLPIYFETWRLSTSLTRGGIDSMSYLNYSGLSPCHKLSQMDMVTASLLQDVHNDSLTLV